MIALTASLLLSVAQQSALPLHPVQAAARALAAGETEAARAALESVAPAQRAFEWHHVRLRLDLAAEEATGGPSAVSRLAGTATSTGPVVFAPDGRHLIGSGDHGALRWWDARDGRLLHTLDAATRNAHAAAFSPAGDRVLAASAGFVARVWSTDGWEQRLELRGHEAAVGPVAWSPDGTRLATGSDDRTLRLWDAASGVLQLTVRGHAAELTAVDFDAAARRVLSAARDGTARIFEARNGAQFQVLRGGDGAVTAAAFDPAGRRVATGHADAHVRVWEVETGALLRTLAGHTQPVTRVAWQPDGARLASASEDGTVRIHDPETAATVLVIAGHRGTISSAAYAPGGARLATACEDGVVRIFETERDAARAAQTGGAVDLPDDDAAAEMKPLELDGRLRRVLLRTDLAPDVCARALELARANQERLPDSGQVAATLGAAQYRAGSAAEALETLLAAHEKRRGWPPTLGFRVLCLVRLERMDEARDWARRLEVLLSEPRWKDNQEARELSAEVRRAVGGSAR